MASTQMGKRTTKRQAENVGKAIVAALQSNGVITSAQANNVTIVVGGHRKKLRTEPRKPHNNKQWKRHCHHPLKRG